MEFLPETLDDFDELLPTEVAKSIKSNESAEVQNQSVKPHLDDATTLRYLASISPIEYDRIRKEYAKTLGVRPVTLDKLIQAGRKGLDRQSIDFESIDAWPEPVNPAELLTEIRDSIQRFIVCDAEIAITASLWIAMTWFIDVIQIAPLAIITAPEKRCGKSQLLFLLGRMVCRPLMAANISPAALFRAIDAWQPTLLVDEADAFMRDNDELRGLINCGHTRESAYIIRVVGENFIPTRFNVWGAKVISGIGHLADTLMDRAVILELRRKLPHEQVERLRHAEPELFSTLSAKLARFAEDYHEQIRTARPHLPEALNDRAQDNWEALLAIADVAAGLWPELARKAALKLAGAEDAQMSRNQVLLADIQAIFSSLHTDRIFTVDLITALCLDEAKGWASCHKNQPITAKQIADNLKGYKIQPKDVRIGHQVKKGYCLEEFTDAFNRYLSNKIIPANIPASAATTLQANADKACSVADENLQTLHPASASISATQNLGQGLQNNATCCGNNQSGATPKPAAFKTCSAVADKTAETVTQLLQDDVEWF